jgi:homoprotocatechuate degradation regulator HpaR
MAGKVNRGAAMRTAVAKPAANQVPVIAPPLLRPFSKSLPMALLRARETVMRHFRPSLHALGLTEQQWRVLRALACKDEIEVTALADLTFLLPPSLTRILRVLERRKLVRRRADPGDLRSSLISLAPRGRTIVAKHGNHSEHIYRVLEQQFGEARMQILMVMLSDIEHELQAPAETDQQPLGKAQARRRTIG